MKTLKAMQIKIEILIKIDDYNIIIVEQKYNEKIKQIIIEIINMNENANEKMKKKKKLFEYSLFTINIVNYLYLQLN